MNNTVTPIKDIAGKVRDFIVEYECEGCKRRRAVMTEFARAAEQRARAVDKRVRDMLRRQGRI